MYITIHTIIRGWSLSHFTLLLYYFANILSFFYTKIPIFFCSKNVKISAHIYNGGIAR